MPPSGVDYASEFLNGYAPEYVTASKIILVIFQIMICLPTQVIFFFMLNNSITQRV